MGEHTDHIRRIGRSVQDAKRLKQEIQSICGEIDALLAQSRAAKRKRKAAKAAAKPSR
jgi:hypothetical protein